MSWPDTYLDARFRGVVFDCLSLGEEVARATVAHSYPFRDGAEIEDLGLQATRISVRATLFGINADRQLQQLKDALDLPGAGELVHPIYGVLQVVVDSYRPAFDADNTDSVALDITFIESAPRAPFFDLTIPEAQIDALDTARLDSFTLARDSFAQSLRGILAVANNNRLSHLLDDISQTLAQAAQLGGVLQNTAQSYLDAPAALTADLYNLMAGVAPQASVSSFNGIPVYAGMINSGSASGSASGGASNSAAYVATVEQFSVAQQRLAQPLAGLPVPPNLSVVMQQDTALIAAHMQLVAVLVLSQTAQEVLAAELMQAQATPPQIEAMANAVRGALQAQITVQTALYPLELARPIAESLKTLALQVQQAALQVIALRPPLLVRAAPVTGNLRLIAHALYGAHERAPELLRLNPALRQPNFIAQGEALNAYAK